MRIRWPILVGGLVLAGVALWLLTSRAPGVRSSLAGVSNPLIPVRAEELPQPTVEHPENTPGAAAQPALPPPVPVQIQRPAAAVAAHMEPAPEPETGLPPLTVMENMRSALRQYSSRFGGNPVGNNREITAALNGGNAKQAMFVNSEDGLRLNERSELIDNWGTPFFFHQISGTLMEIHSAGPDKKMWTADDLVMK
jgi:hypothetical protein